MLYNQSTYEMYNPVWEPSGFDCSVVTEISPLYLNWSMSDSAVCFTLHWDRGGALFLPTFHLVSSTIKLNGGIPAGSYGRSLLNVSANSVQRVRNRDCRSSSPERCTRAIMSVSEDVVDHGLKVSVLSWSISSSSLRGALESCSNSRTNDASMRDVSVGDV